jgi:hypothetical protein
VKLLFENWRQYLNEDIDSRIQRQIDNLLAIPDAGIAVDITGRDVVYVKYIIIEDFDAGAYRTPSQHTRFSDKIYPKGNVSFEHASTWENEEDAPTCFEGYIVEYAAADSPWGPLLYEVAIEWASRVPPPAGGLTSDRHSVSSEAQSVWDKYLVRAGEGSSKIKAKQMDIDNPDIYYPLRLQQLTPDIKYDDCDQQKAVSIGGDRWMDTSLSKMFYQPNQEVTDILKQEKRFIEDKRPTRR